MQAFTVEAVLKLLTSDFDSSLNQSESKASAFGTNVKKGLATVAKVGATALAAASAAVIKFGSDSVQTGMEFDQSMSQVYATMGDKANEMVKYNGQTISSMEALRDFAMEMGRTTQYTASQSADALNYMALAGYDAETSMAMLPNVMALASAGAFDLATASDMVTDTQTAFGISIDRTSQMVDEMAKAASTGNTSVEQLGQAFLTVGGLAQELNGGMVTLSDGTVQSVDGIQELEIALTAMANAGIKGSEAGTHMRNMLLKLSSPTADGAAQMEALGVSVFDTEGNMRSLQDIMGDLNGALGDLTQEEKIQAISDLFNTRDLASAEALLGAVGQDWDEIGASILDAEGAAKQMQEVQLDNLAGDITIFKSALDGAKIAISDKLTPTIREFVQFGTEGISQLTDAFKDGGLEGAAEALGNIASDGAKKLSQKLPTLLKAGKNLITSLTKGISSALPSIIEMLPDILSTFMDLIFEVAESILDALPDVIDKLAETLPSLISTFITKILDNLPKIIDGLISVVLAIVDNIPTIIQGLIDELPHIIESLITALMDSLPSIISGLIQLTLAIVMHLPEIIMALIEAIPTIVLTLVSTLIENFPKFLEAIGTLIVDIWNKVSNWAKELPEKIKQWWNDLCDKVGEWFGNLIGVVDENGDGIWDDIAKWLVDLADSVKKWFDDRIQAVKDFFSNIWDKVSGFFINIYNTVKNKLVEIWNNITNKFDEMRTNVSNFFSNIWNSVTGWFSSLKTKVSGWVSDIWQTIKNKFANARQIGENLVTGLWNGIAGSAKWLWNKITNWLSGIWSGIKNFFGIHSPSRQMAWAGQMLAEGLANGIDKYADKAIDAALDMAEGINDAVDLSSDTLTADASAGYNANKSVGDTIIMNIYGAVGQDANELAEIVIDKLEFMRKSKEAIFA